MTQSVDQHSTRWFSQRRLWLLVVWGAFAAILLAAWPVEPRLTLGKGGYLDVVGITPDSQELITFTRRATRDQNAEVKTFASGPVNVLDLNTGSRRSYCVPGQTCSGRLIPYGNDGGMVMEESLGLELTNGDVSIGGDQISFYQVKSRGGLGHHELMALNFKNGDFRVLKRIEKDRLPLGLKTGLSPRGRWYLECIEEDDGVASRLYRIIEIGTEKEMFQFQSDDFERNSCYSPDDSHFACCYSNGHVITTQIWHVETGKVVSTYAERLHGLAFSQDHRFLAGYTHRRRDQYPSYRDVLVLDVQTAQVVRRLRMDIDKLNDGMFGSLFMSRLEFLDNDHWLVWHDTIASTPFEGPVHERIIRILSWDLQSNKQHVNFSETRLDGHYPEPTHSGERLKTSQYIICRNDDRIEEAFEITTGRKVATLPKDAESIRITPEILLLEQKEEFWLSRFLEARGIAIPRFASSMIPEPSYRWYFIGLPTGRILSSIPQQDQICWLSPDRKSLVTRPSKGGPAIHVWDFPPRQPRVKPLLWSLLVPGIVVIWLAWKYRRRLITRAARPKLSPGAESTTLESS